MKALDVKFTRNPKYTPAGLTEFQLTRVEWLVKATFSRHLPRYQAGDWDIHSGKDALASQTKKWFAPYWKSEHDAGVRESEILPQRKDNHDKTMQWMTGNPDCQKYFISCWNYLLAVARNNGEIKDAEKHNRSYYAEQYSGYN
jgi:hypothetical protein